MGSLGIPYSKGPEKPKKKLLHTGQVDTSIETEKESKQLSLAVQFFYLRKQNFLSIIL